MRKPTAPSSGTATTPQLVPRPPRPSVVQQHDEPVSYSTQRRRLRAQLGTERSQPGRLGPLFGKNGGARNVARLPDDAIRQIVWDRLPKEPFVAYKRALAEAASDIAMEAATVQVEVKPAAASTPESRVLVELAEEVGIVIPGLGTALASLKLGGKVKELVKTLSDRSTIVDFDMRDAQAATFMTLGMQGLQTLLENQAKQIGFMVATYTYDVATSIVDFTGLSRLPSSGARLVQKVIAAIVASRKAKELNAAIEDFRKFDLNVFRRNPILACYFIRDLPSADLMGVFDAFYLEDLEQGGREQVLSRLAAYDKRAIDIFELKVLPLREIARLRIDAHAYCFESEVAKRADKTAWTFVKSGDDKAGPVVPKTEAERAAARRKAMLAHQILQRKIWAQNPVQPVKSRPTSLNRAYNPLRPLIETEDDKARKRKKADADAKLRRALEGYKAARHTYHRSTRSTEGDRAAAGRKMMAAHKEMEVYRKKFLAMRKAYRTKFPRIGK